ncbi:aggregation-promoting factor C-terminal-like domain-containing protein, partial [Lactobacillus delbrueckii subsp. bulgaricus]|nr:peptidoglycan-binding protein LysM [Lactobacillus delbrueckii subsp. bulgaricus]
KKSSEKAAKYWIAMRESGGYYTARNGSCYGRYQLLISYLGGDLSKKNQERTADRYVYGRYGSWVNAKRFWLAHNWY